MGKKQKETTKDVKTRTEEVIAEKFADALAEEGISEEAAKRIIRLAAEKKDRHRIIDHEEPETEEEKNVREAMRNFKFSDVTNSFQTKIIGFMEKRRGTNAIDFLLSTGPSEEYIMYLKANGMFDEQTVILSATPKKSVVRDKFIVTDGTVKVSEGLINASLRCITIKPKKEAVGFVTGLSPFNANEYAKLINPAFQNTVKETKEEKGIIDTVKNWWDEWEFVNPFKKTSNSVSEENADDDDDDEVVEQKVA